MHRYHVALCKGPGKTLRVVLRQDKDCLPAEVWIYAGERLITKRELQGRKESIRLAANSSYAQDFERVVIS